MKFEFLFILISACNPFGNNTESRFQNAEISDVFNQPNHFQSAIRFERNPRRTMFVSNPACGILSRFAMDSYSVWEFNAESNAQAYGKMLGLDGACDFDSVCNGEPARCHLSMYFYLPNAWPPIWDIRIADLECSNVLNCNSSFDPHICCREI